MISPELLAVLILHVYALGVAATVAGFLARRTWLKRTAFFCMAVAFVGHTLLVALIFSPHDLPEYMQLLAWSVALVGLSAWLRWRFEALLLMLGPVVLVLLFMAQLLGAQAIALPAAVSNMLSIIHIGSLFASIGLMALAFGAAVLFLLQAHSIKSKAPLSPFQKDLPSLAVLDKVNALAVSAGFPLFTIGILFGLIAARGVWEGGFTADPKGWISLVLWALFAWLYHQRLARGWQGRKPAVLAIWIFAVCVFSLTVVNLFMPTHHSFLTTLR